MSHEFARGVQLVGAVLFDGMDALFFHIACHDARKGSSQVGGKCVHRLVGAQVQGGHGGMARLERGLEIQRDSQPPVKVKGIVIVTAEQGQLVDAMAQGFRDRFRVIDDDLVTLCRLLTQGSTNKGVHLAKIVGAAGGPGKDYRQGHVDIVRVQQHAQQVENFLGGADPPRKDNDAMADTQEGLKPFFNIWHDHQFIDDGVGGFRGDNARLGNPQIAASFEPLLGMGHMRPFHWALHGPGATTGADILVAQAQLVTHTLAVVVFLAGNAVPPPAHHHIGGGAGTQNPRIAKDVKHRIGDPVAAIEIEAVVVLNLVGHVDNVTQHG